MEILETFSLTFPNHFFKNILEQIFPSIKQAENLKTAFYTALFPGNQLNILTVWTWVLSGRVFCCLCLGRVIFVVVSFKIAKHPYS